ncbi:hypothetical protein N0V90_012494 [Kalmusia sp. IMI 367209]|nr:hypothetical protein N0V90_012494 [Kalmusia sp. IMI 367209]
MPSESAQMAAIKQAYDQAVLLPRDTVYVEAHGTGTQVGDRTEAKALSQAFCKESQRNNTLLVGSVKANIGYTEPVAGLAGMIKSVLMLEKNLIPANIAFRTPREDVPLKTWGLSNGTLSNGNGINHAHVQERLNRASETRARPRLFAFSHAREQGMREMATRFADFVRGRQLSENDLDDLSYTLASRRSTLEYRSAFVAQDPGELLQRLNDLANGVTRQGAQWAQMGAELLSLYPIFALSLERSAVWLREDGADWDLLAEIGKSKSESRINDAELSQPCCTALQVALVDLLRSFGLYPDTVCGHSSGEIAAAYAAGFLKARDALRIAFHRGRAITQLKRDWPQLSGGMLAVGLSVADVRKYLHSSRGSVSVAAINSPRSVTVSGDKAAIQDVKSQLDSDDIFNRLLVVDVAYHHAAHMEKVSSKYVAQIGELSHPRKRHASRMFSSVTGKEIADGDLDAGYWGRNLVSPVLFADALIQALSKPKSSHAERIVVEIGPHAALRGPIKETTKEKSQIQVLNYHSLLSRNEHAGCTILRAVGALFEHGVKVRHDFASLSSTADLPRVMTSLPTYPWTHGRQHWSESRISKQYRHRRFPRHDLLGTPVSESVGPNHAWCNFIDVKKLPWTTGHRVTSHNAFPAAAYFCAVIEALRQRAIAESRSLKHAVFHFRQTSIEKALFLPEEQEDIEVIVSLHPYDNSNADSSILWRSFSILSVTKAGETVRHCVGLVACKAFESSSNVQEFMGATVQSPSAVDLPRLTTINARKFYTQAKSIGMEYTGPFASLKEIQAASGHALCVATIPDVRSIMPAFHQQTHCIHPATLDTCLQTMFVLMQSLGTLNAAVLDRIDELIVSSGISSRPGTKLTITGRSLDSPYKANISVRQGSGMGPLVIQVMGAHLASQQDMSTINTHSYSQAIEWCLDPALANATEVSEHVGISGPSDAVSRRNRLNNEFCRRVIGKVLSSISPEDEKKISGHFLKSLQWMRIPGHASNEPVTQSMRRDITPLGVTSEALLRFEDKFRSILLGEVDPMSVFLQDGLLYRIYGSSPYDRPNYIAAKYIELLERKNPQMRVLEIGAGTAATTASILDQVYANGRRAKLDRFVFTDISSGFFEAAREKLARYADILDFRKLDIEYSPLDQGFEPGTFDLIIASNVLHATVSIKRSLEHAKVLLKPTGKLVLVELILPQTGPLSTPLLFGMLPGWWLGQDEGREMSPLLSAPQWHKILLDSGFSGLDAEFQDFPDDGHEISVLVSTVKDNPNAPKPTRLSVISSPETNDVANELLKLAIAQNPGVDIEKGTMDTIGTSSAYVILPEMVDSFLATCTSDQWEHFKRVASQAEIVVWVTRGSSIETTDPYRALIHGLSRTIRAENRSMVIATLDLDPHCREKNVAEDARRIYDIYEHVTTREIGNDPPDFEYAIRKNQVLTPRIMDDKRVHNHVKDAISVYHPVLQSINQHERTLELHVNTPGLLDTLHWRSSVRHSRSPSANEVRVQMRFLSLNFKDLMTSLGQLEGFSAMLIEGAGVIVEVGETAQDHYAVGDLVAGFAADSLATSSNIDFCNVQRIPNGMTLEEAASISVAYATAYHSLVNIAHIQEGESILIHSAAGAVGQAAVALAQYLKVGEIFITVGSSEKRQFMTEQFKIPKENIFSSRDTAFKQAIYRQTDRRGVDIVLNSLTGEAARESLNLLCPFGRFVEIGKKDLLTNARLEMLPLEKNITFATADLAMVAQDKPALCKQLLETVFDLVHSQKVQMIAPVTVSSVSKLHETFKVMQSGKHMGKLVLSIDDDALVPVQPQKPIVPTLDPEASYLVVGGTGGLGRAIIRHFADLGAKHIITLSRTGSANGEVTELIDELDARGVELVVTKGSVTDRGDLEALKKQTHGRPIRGIVQGAMVLQDASFYTMTYSQWRAALDPKVTGTWNLHEVFGTSLDHFILLSSIGGTSGERGQGNYGAGCTFQDAFARHRTSIGLPVRSINIATVEGEGYVAENPAVMERMRNEGYQMQALPELLAIIDYAIAHPVPDFADAAQIVCGAHFPRPDRESGARRLDARFSHTWTTTQQASASTATDARTDYSSLLKAARSSAQAAEVANAALNSKLARLLDASTDDFVSHRSLPSYGLDSLIAVELRNWIAKELRAPLQTFELMSPMSLAELAGVVARRSELVSAKVFREEGE